MPVGFAFPMAAARVVVETAETADSILAGVVVAVAVDSILVGVVVAVVAADSILVEMIEVEIAWPLTDLMHARRVPGDRCERVSRYRGQPGRLEQRE